MRKKLKSRKGFSLTEVLVAVLIMAMVTGVVAAGMPAAIDAYHNIVDLANAQLLLTTTTSALRNELDLARDIKINGKTIDFRGTSGTMSRIEFTDGQSVKLYEYIGYATEVLDAEAASTQVTSEGFSRPLVSEATAPDSLYIQVDSITKDGNVLSFNNVAVHKGSNTLASISQYVIKTEN